ncbi:MAG: DUF503 family protein [Bacteriovoracia bacterium]
MWVGVGRIVLDFYNNDNVALKRRKLEELCKDLRREFNLSAMEVDELDDPEKCVFGFAAVMPAGWKEQSARSFVQKICEKIDQTAFGRVMVDDWDVWSYGE